MSNERMAKNRHNTSNHSNSNSNNNNNISTHKGHKKKNSSEKINVKNSELNNNELKHSSTEGDFSKLYLVNTQAPFHHVRDSLLTSASGFKNYRGILNLCVVLLVMSTGRLVIENIIKYGVLVRFDILILFIKDPTAWPSALAFVCSNFFILFALWCELKLEKDEISEKMGSILFISNIITTLVLPAVYLWYRETNPIASFFALAFYTCLFMKLLSYYQVNKQLRTERKLKKKFSISDSPITPKSSYQQNHSYQPNENNHINNSKTASNGQIPETANSKDVVHVMKHNQIHHVKSCQTLTGQYNLNSHYDIEREKKEIEEEVLSHCPQPLVSYPDNLNLKDIYYFIAVPTLCYEINFPRTARIRKRFLIKRLTEIAFLVTLQIMLLQQWIVPILKNSKDPFRESNTLKIVERVLKLAVPNHVIWLISFYALFHSYLNILAELLRFGDRQFYKDWWNAENVEQFWKNWNIPVHSFCLRHIYIPLLYQGVTKMQASLVVFFISAFFHEYLVSIPLRMFRLWAFSGMLAQVPFAAFVKKYLHGNYGNMAVWISLIIGQPASIMMYIHDYYIDYFRNSN